MSTRQQQNDSSRPRRSRRLARSSRTPSSRHSSTSRVSAASSLPSPEITPLDDEFRDHDDRPATGTREDDENSSTGSDQDTDSVPPLDDTSPVERALPTFAAPSIVIGAPYSTGLSAIEEADAEVGRWELIYDEILRAQGPKAVTGIIEQLEEARETRAMLDLVEDRDMVENTL